MIALIPFVQDTNKLKGVSGSISFYTNLTSTHIKRFGRAVSPVNVVVVFPESEYCSNIHPVCRVHQDEVPPVDVEVVVSESLSGNVGS